MLAETQKECHHNTYPNRPLLFITINWCKYGISFVLLGYNFKLDDSTIGRIVKDTMDVNIDQLWSIQVQWMNAHELSKSDMHFDNFPYALGTVDGSTQRINKPSTNSDNYYDDKRKLMIQIHQ